jgi:hypothetical protein
MKNNGSAPWPDQIINARSNQINADAVNAFQYQWRRG